MKTIQASQGSMMEIGTTIALLLLLVGVLNYANTIASGIQNRKLTFAIMESHRNVRETDKPALNPGRNPLRVLLRPAHPDRRLRRHLPLLSVHELHGNPRSGYQYSRYSARSPLSRPSARQRRRCPIKS